MKRFTWFVTNALRLLLPIIICATIFFIYKNRNGVTSFSAGMLCLEAALALLLYTGILGKVGFKILFGYIILVSLVLRVLWFLNIDSLPTSDFAIMFQSAGEFIQGNFYMFQGNNYFARFPHLSMTVMYFGLIRKMFTDPISMIRIFNIIFSMVDLFLLYFIAREIFKDRNKSLWVMLVAGLFPPMIYYNNVFATENLAMPLLLISVLFFLKAVEKKGAGRFICAGIFLGAAHLFRPVGYVVAVAYTIYGLIYYEKQIKQKLVAVSGLIVSAVLPIVLVSAVLIQAGILQYPLWHGTEPPSTSILKGTNIASGGKWNAEDAAVFDRFGGDYAKVNAECKRIIFERFKETPILEWVKFYVAKYGDQWMAGDFSGTYWAEAGHTDPYTQSLFANGAHSGNKMVIALSSQGLLFHQIVWLCLLLLSYAGFYRKETLKNPKVTFLYILFCGFALFYLITETQARYGFIASWLFPILAVTPFYRANAEYPEPSELTEIPEPSNIPQTTGIADESEMSVSAHK